ncbi:2-oxoisovalerate dehydrogenase E2 component (dihydrolipoyl transacylase) [Ensifer adhaerens]|uniref:2-oxoisovalerate dehydrogenase E2 component (Dihydrolipoyl transacylase) n=1 Tax=Ensifer adhaerens TaxID=106592 RepID=A0ACC5T688_ENSAD|nr:dihydrolipoamide acetyltransferase family protein [Ensifer adhaerens]MBP1876590.1 2-oxoisovalerate dehydrogenase E2 component (dihydrolipoyl transacylase) [Ensifer adhaerens]
MGEFVIKMPDVGEGVAEAELVEWHVKPGDPVREDMILAAVMTDKATVEIPSPVNGTVLWLGAEIGDTVAVKAPLVRIEIAGEGEATPALDEKPVAKEEEKPAAKAETATPVAKPAQPAKVEVKTPAPGANGVHVSPERLEKALASPAVRQRARDSGVDLRQVSGSGPAGRITHDDLDQFLARGAQPAAVPAGLVRKTAVDEIKVTGLRRRIAEKMTLSTSRIPHITYVEEVDMTALEDLRTMMNRDRKPDQPKLTILPYLMRALVRAIADLPGVNSTFDDGAGIISRHHAVHIGIATQTPAGLTVPVVRHAEARGIWDCAIELNRLAEAARTGTATRDELTGSTITISSLGALGGIVSTPVINHPEVAIVGVNKLAVRPVWDGTQFVPRKIMNLSSSFDHRVIDGWDAATFVQRLKTLLETPALIFVEA